MSPTWRSLHSSLSFCTLELGVPLCCRLSGLPGLFCIDSHEHLAFRELGHDSVGLLQLPSEHALPRHATRP